MAAKKRKRRNYTPTFKKQIVQLYQNGKSKSDIAKEYDIHVSVIGRWLSQYDNSGSFKEKENRSELELENIKLKILIGLTLSSALKSILEEMIVRF